MAPKRKAGEDLSQQVGRRRSKRQRKDDTQSSSHSGGGQLDTVDNSGSVSNTGSVAGSVSLSELADIMIDKMTQRGLIFSQPPSDARSQGQRQDPGLNSNNANTQQEQSRDGAVAASSSMLNNDKQGQQNVSTGHKSAAQHDPSSKQSSPDQSSVEHNGSSDKEIEQLLNGTTSNTNALPLNQSYSYGLSLSALVPEKIKEKIWDKKYVEMAQLYQIQTRGEVKHDFSVYISNQGPSTLVKVQPKQTQGQELSINQWLTAFNCYMDIYVQKFPDETSGLLAYMNLVRDLDRLCGTQSFNYYDRSFRAHRQSQALPWGQMQTEIWNKAILLSLTNHPNQAASRSSVVSSFKSGNQKFCFAYNSTQGCTRRPCRFNHSCSFCYKKHPRVNCYAFSNKKRAPQSHDSFTSQSQVAPSQNTTAGNNQGTGSSTFPIQTRAQPFRGNK